jgi:hypothetical protein
MKAHALVKWELPLKDVDSLLVSQNSIGMMVLFGGNLRTTQSGALSDVQSVN